jgi:hypothetical protein
MPDTFSVSGTFYMKNLFLILLASTVLGLAGCGDSGGGDGLSSDQKQAATRLDEIAKASDGDWTKVSPEDQKYILDTIAHGSEQSAKMLLLSKAGKLKASPGGAPAPK